MRAASPPPVEERQKAFEAKASDIRGRARNIAARSNQLGRSTAAEMKAIAASSVRHPSSDDSPAICASPTGPIKWLGEICPVRSPPSVDRISALFPAMTRTASGNTSSGSGR